MNNILHISSPNVYARFVGAPELHPLVMRKNVVIVYPKQMIPAAPPVVPSRKARISSLFSLDIDSSFSRNRPF